MLVRRRSLFVLLYLLLAIGGACVAVAAFGAQTYRWRAFTLRVSVAPAFTSASGAGQTRLAIPPLGEVRASTHATPLLFQAELTAVAIDDLKALALKPPPRSALERELQNFAGRSVKSLALRLLLAGAAGALIAPLLFRSRQLYEWLAAPFVGALLIGALLLLTRASFRPDAFRTAPSYTGSLAQAPQLIALAQNAVSNTQALGVRLRNVSVNLGALYGRIDAAARDPAGDRETLKVLHISDIHNNPAAVSFVRDLIREFGVALVIDTGDLTDFGTSVETQAVRELASIGVPYVFVAGNHDSQAVIRAVERDLHGVVLRDSSAPISVAGLSILGAPDPSSARAETGSVDTDLKALESAGTQLKASYLASKMPPDIVCVHNPLQGDALIGTARLILCGHLHRASVETQKGDKDGAIVCNAGTTGAAGGRYFERPEGVPFSAAILHFSRPAGPAASASPSLASPSLVGATPAPSPPARPRLLFIDLVVLDGSLRQYSITRYAVGAASIANAPAMTAPVADLASPSPGPTR